MQHCALREPSSCSLIPAPPPAGATQAGAEGGAAALEESIAPALAACDAALGRCLKLTGGTALPVLARVLDRALQQYVAAAQAAVAAIRSRLAELDAAQDAGAEGAEAVLPLLTVASQLVQQLAALEASLRAAAAEAAPPLLEVSTPGAASTQAGQLPSAAELRLRAQPIVRQQLAGFAANAADGAPLLPLARAAASELEQAVGGCVLEALGARPRAQLAQLLRLPEWQQRSAAGALPLPTFSSYPLQYITSGEGSDSGCFAGVVGRGSAGAAGVCAAAGTPAPGCAPPAGGRSMRTCAPAALRI